MLILPIKKQWYDMILSGEKKEEYREIKPYYEKRFSTYFMGENSLLVNGKKGTLSFVTAILQSLRALLLNVS